MKVSQYPLPRKMITKLAESTEKLLVLEEGYPVIEESIKGYLEKEAVHGRLDGTLPRDGELNPDHVAKEMCIRDRKNTLMKQNLFWLWHQN